MLKEKPFSAFLENLSGDPFAYTQLGLNEWNVLFGFPSTAVPRTGKWYCERLASDLSRFVKNRPRFAIGVPPVVRDELSPMIENYIAANDLQSIDWWSSDGFRPVDIPQFERLLEVVKKNKFVVVGPPELVKAKSALKFTHFITVPPRNAYLCYRDIASETLSYLNDVKSKCIVSVNAGIATSLIIDILFRNMGARHTFVDFGSVWDTLKRF